MTQEDIPALCFIGIILIILGCICRDMVIKFTRSNGTTEHHSISLIRRDQ